MLLLPFLWVVTSGSSCKTGLSAIRDSEGGLVKRAEKFNRMLRWQRYGLARSYLAPAIRSSYVERWTRNQGKLKVTEVEIKDVSLLAKGKRAFILVTMKWYELPSVILRETVVIQRWQSFKGLWLFVGEGRTWQTPPPKDR